MDADGDGLPDGLNLGIGVGAYSNVLAFGYNEGAVTGGRVSASFEGTLDAAGETFLGDHEMILGNVSAASHPWNPRLIDLRFYDVATPEEPSTYHECSLNIYPPYGGTVTLSPGDHLTVDHHYCMSRLN